MFKVTLREMFLLVALAGIGCAWWIQNREVHRLRDELFLERLSTELATQHEQERIRDMVGMAEAVEREGYSIFADVKRGPHGVRLVRLDEDEANASVAEGAQ